MTDSIDGDRTPRENAEATPGRRWLVPALVPTAAVLVIVAAWMVGTRERADRLGPVPGAQGRYMLLLYEGPSFEPGEGGGALEYARWADSLGKAGIAVEGEELGPEGATLGADATAGADPAAGGDPADPNELGRLGGYMIVAAPDLDAAVALARIHPHLRHGGAILVRPIVER